MRSPPKPWERGKHPLYSAFQLVVNVCQDEHGNVWSDHDFPTDEDGQVALSLPQGGAPQIAHALMTEAVRREAFLCALIELTKEADLLQRWAAGDEAVRRSIEEDLAHAATRVIERTLTKMVPGAVSSVLAMMAEQSVGQPPKPSE